MGFRARSWEDIGFSLCVLLVFVLIAVLFFFNLPFSPEPGGDETSLNNIPYRFVHYGDMRYPLFYSERYNSGDIRVFPPILAFQTRSVYHALIGFSGHTGRIFSALSLTLVIAALAISVHKGSRSRWLTLLITLIFISSPTVFLLARTVRLEQEAVLFGTLGLILPIVLLWRTDAEGLRNAYRSKMSWAIIGAVMSLGASVHPLALGFALALMANLALCHKAWRKVDGLSAGSRMMFFILGALPAFAATIAALFAAHGSLAEYNADAVHLYGIRKEQFTDIFVRQFGWWGTVFAAVGGRVFAANLYEFLNYNFSNIDFFPNVFSLLSSLAFVAGLIICAIGAYANRATLSLDQYLPFWLGLCGFIFLAGIYFVYPPNQTYGIYAVVGWLGAVGLGCFRVGVITSEKGRYIRSGYIAVALLALAGTLPNAVRHGWTLLTLDTTAVVTWDRQANALRQMGQTIGLGADGGRVYTDTLAWPAAPKNQGALVDLLSGVQEHRLSGLAVRGDVAEFFIEFFPTVYRPPRSADEKAALYRHLRAQLRLAGLVLVKPNRAAYYLYTLRAASTVNSDCDLASEILVTLLDGLSTSHWRGRAAGNERAKNLSLGTYLVIAPAQEGRGGDSVLASFRGEHIDQVFVSAMTQSRNVPTVVLLTVNKAGTSSDLAPKGTCMRHLERSD